MSGSLASGEGPAAYERLSLLDASWRVPGHHGFKALVGELRLLLEDGRAKLGELEPALLPEAAHVLLEAIRSGFAADVVQLSSQIDFAHRLAVPAERAGLREYSQRHLHELLMQSPVMHHARHKPLGYPGDYLLMNDLYGDPFRGATLFAKAVNLAFVSTPAALAVRARKDRIKQRLAALLDADPRPGPLRILSIAAGPAQEIYELLCERDSLPSRLEIVLLDQDRRALAFSHDRLQPLVSAKWRDQVEVVHLHDSIRHLLRDAAGLQDHGEFDAVYCAGLFDYLQRATAVALCRLLFARVAAGGWLCIGNMVPSCASRWVMELHLDWFLVYRERSQLLELARAAAPDAAIDLLEEESGVNPLVALTRG